MSDGQHARLNYAESEEDERRCGTEKERDEETNALHQWEFFYPRACKVTLLTFRTHRRIVQSPV